MSRHPLKADVKSWAADNGIPSIFSLATSPDGNWLAANCASRVGLWDFRTGEKRLILDNSQITGHQVAEFSPDSEYMATFTTNEIALLNPASGKLIRTLKEPGLEAGATCRPIFNFKEQLLVIQKAGTIATNIIGWRVGDGERITEPSWSKIWYAQWIACSPDGLLIACSEVLNVETKSTAIKVFNATSGDLVTTIPQAAGSSTPINVKFSADGKTLAWSERVEKPLGTRIRLAETGTWKELPGPPALSGTTAALSFALHPFGAATCNSSSGWNSAPVGVVRGQRFRARFWPGPFGKEARTLGYTPEGSYLAVGDVNGQVSILRLPAESAPGMLPSIKVSLSEPLPFSRRNFPEPSDPHAVMLAKKTSAADSLKRSEIPADILAKLGTGNNDAPQELESFGKVFDP